MRLSLPQLVALTQRHGFPDPRLAAAVAMAESGGDAAAVNDTSAQTVFPPGIGPETSVGLWQVNLLAHPQYAAWDLTDPDANAAAAFQVSSGGKDWRPWSTYVSGAYRPYYPSAQTLVVPSRRAATGAMVATAAVLTLATAAGYAALERRRFAS